MKQFCFFSVFLVLVVFSGCSSAPKDYSPPAPRREYQSVDTSSLPAKEPSIVGEFTPESEYNSEVSFGQGSVNFSTALFLSDLGLLDGASKDLFEKYAGTLFSQFPAEGSVKEIVIPALSLTEESDAEKDAYLFITKQKTSEGRDYYSIETNIPVASSYGKTYDGYVMNLNGAFHKDNVPGNWTSVMSIQTNRGLVIYSGIAYPSKSALLHFSGTGIGSDTRMNAVLGEETAAEVASQLKNAVDKALANTPADDPAISASMQFLKKCAYLSLAAYSYIDSNFEEAKENFRLAQESEAAIPADTMGSRYAELENIMGCLLETQ